MAMPPDVDYLREQLSKLKTSLDEVHNTVHSKEWGYEEGEVADATATSEEYAESDKRQHPSYGDYDAKEDEAEAAKPGTGSDKSPRMVHEGDDGDEYDAGHAIAERKKKKAAEDLKRLLGK